MTLPASKVGGEPDISRRIRRGRVFKDSVLGLDEVAGGYEVFRHLVLDWTIDPVMRLGCALSGMERGVVEEGEGGVRVECGAFA
jgi:hypothetical protein